MRRAKIVATIGPASESPEHLRALVSAGMDVARINLSHGDRAHHIDVIGRLREAAATARRSVAVLADLCGPKIRTGKLKGGAPVELASGATIRLTSEEVEGTAETVSVSYPRLADEVAPGDRILIDDGLIELRVEGVDAGQVVARALNSGTLRERKGVNLPGAKLSIPSLTDKDRADLSAVLDEGVDYVALSFVRTATDCRVVRELIDARDPHVKLIAKIEKPEALDNLDEIFRIVDGVMVARGDLGVEMPPESVPIHQKRIIAKAVESEKVVITATQMLQSMVEQPRPTRAEASDVANAIIDGTDAVMLSGETAAGKYPVLSVETMDRIIRFTETERAIDHGRVGRLLDVQMGSEGRALAEAAMFAANEIQTRMLVVFSQSGDMARHVAALRPTQRIVALTPGEGIYRQLAAVWGVEPYMVSFSYTSDELLALGDRALIEFGIATRGTPVVLITGHIPGTAASSMIKLHRVGDMVGL